MASAGIFGFLGGSIDNFLGAFVTKTATAMSTAITPIVITGLTIWVIVYGLAVMRNEVSEPFSVFAWKAFKISLILSFALSGGIYQSEIVEGANAFQNALSQIVAPTGGGDIYKVLDDFDNRGAQLAIEIIKQGVYALPVGGWLDLGAGLLVFIASAALLIIAGGFTIIAKVAIAFVLGVGPMFIATLAFPPVAKFFDAWLAKLVNYSLLIMILAFSIALSISICDAYLATMQASQDSTNAIADAFGLVILSCCLVLLVWQSPNLAAGLAGGSALSGGGLGQVAVGYLMGMKSQVGGNKDKGGGGNIENGGGSDGGGSGGGGSGGSYRGDSGGGRRNTDRIPAYKRASADRYQS